MQPTPHKPLNCCHSNMEMTQLLRTRNTLFLKNWNISWANLVDIILVHQCLSLSPSWCILHTFSNVWFLWQPVLLSEKWIFTLVYFEIAPNTLHGNSRNASVEITWLTNCVWPLFTYCLSPNCIMCMLPRQQVYSIADESWEVKILDSS